MSFVGIDIGTSFIKGAVLHVDALRMSHIRRVPFPYPLPGLPPLYREFDPHAVISAVQHLLADLLPHAADCDGIVMCSQMHGLVFTTERGEPLSTLTTWQDQRVLLPHPSGQGTYFDVIGQRLGPDEVRQLGNELRPGQPLGILFWLAEQEQLPEAGAIPASLPDFVLANLCHSTPSTELTNAMAHGALNMETLDWHHEVLSRLGVHGLRWPAIRRHGEVVGRLQVGSRGLNPAR
jgi:sugar (pentulose or hexulose) kinase